MAEQEGPGVAACPACGGLLLGDEIPGLRRRTDLRLTIPDTDGHVVAYQCPDPDCGHLWPRYTTGRRAATARALIAWTLSKEALPHDRRPDPTPRPAYPHR